MNIKAIILTIILTIIYFTLVTKTDVKKKIINMDCGNGIYNAESNECFCSLNYKTYPSKNNTQCNHEIFKIYKIDNCHEHYLDEYNYCIEPNICPNKNDQCSFDKEKLECECYHLN